MAFEATKTVDCATTSGVFGVRVTYVQCHVCASPSSIVAIINTKRLAFAVANDGGFPAFIALTFPSLPPFASSRNGAYVIAVWRRPVKSGAHTPLVVLMHGRGADEHDLSPVIDRLPRFFAYVSVRAFVAVEGGGFTWFESRGVAEPMAKSLRASVVTLRSWVDEAAPRSTACYVLGFSAGMMMAGALVLDDPQRFAGAILLSGALAFDSGISAEPGRLRGMPVFYGRGLRDDVIPAALVTQSETYLRVGSGANLTLREYPHAHTISLPEIHDISTWLSERQ